MEHLKLKRIKEGSLYALLFMGFNAIKNMIFDHNNVVSLFQEMSQDKTVGIPLFIITLVSSWFFLSLIIGVGLIIYDFFKNKSVQES
ncbi:hypothetical protein [Desemzia sp. FAM 24101]|uniref:hypothetical protein n=1 Tax=unclassified Desemzia TaxID=2685243 RepID=UPI003888B095